MSLRESRERPEWLACLSALFYTIASGRCFWYCCQWEEEIE